MNILHSIENLYLRLRYGAGCCDVFELRHYLAKKIIKPLKLFRENLYSFPPNLTFKEWKKKLDEMIFAFEFIIEVDSPKYENYSIEELNKLHKKARKGFELFGKYYIDLWL